MSCALARPTYYMLDCWIWKPRRATRHVFQMGILRRLPEGEKLAGMENVGRGGIANQPYPRLL